jgi:carbamoyl-phosphate synthase small subunit
MKAILVLEDKTYFEGNSFGLPGEVPGEVILNTAVVGYQEIMTDPANSQKILVLTYPLIGNYGVSEEFNESERVWIGGVVIKESSQIYSNWQAKSSLEEFLKKERIVGITSIDTRTLAIKMRERGEMIGIISTEDFNLENLLKKITDFKCRKKESILKEVSVKEIKIVEGNPDKKIVIIDLGILRSILQQLINSGFYIILVPYNTSAEEILRLNPQGIIISGGPEDDPEISKVTETTKKLLGKVPILGISTGNRIIAEALDAKTIKMKLGHHGLNYPVKSKDSLKGEITVQNHSFVVDEDSLNQKDIKILERNINDNTIEKLKSEKFKFISIQYYPLSPGLNEIHPVFGEFMDLIKNA